MRVQAMQAQGRYEGRLLLRAACFFQDFHGFFARTTARVRQRIQNAETMGGRRGDLKPRRRN